MRLHVRRLVCSVASGIAVAALPICILELPLDGGILEATRPWIVIMMAPGALAGMVVAGGRIHDINLWIMIPANAAFYTWLVYLASAVWSRRRRRKASSDAGSGGLP